MTDPEAVHLSELLSHASALEPAGADEPRNITALYQISIPKIEAGPLSYVKVLGFPIKSRRRVSLELKLALGYTATTGSPFWPYWLVPVMVPVVVPVVVCTPVLPSRVVLGDHTTILLVKLLQEQ